MLIRYRVVWWDKPTLSYAEEIECGREIAAKGKGPFLDDFLKSAGSTTYREGQTYTKWQVAKSLAILVLMIVAIFAMGKWRVFLVLMSIVLGLYLFSTAVSVFRLNLWLNRLVAQYATFVAKGNQ